ncbi:PAS domain S-box protein [bacterium SCSIO 12643]|nr:PAS domain S-box protein [bacterium SCSIO 12643]
MIDKYPQIQNEFNEFSQSDVTHALQISGMAIWEYDIISRDVKFNENWFVILGYGLDELPPKTSTFYQLLHPEDYDILKDAEKAHLIHNPHGILEVQYRMRTKSGKWKWLRNRSKLIYDEDDHPIKWVGSILDISRLKDSEHQVIQKNQHINAVVNSLSDIIYEIDEDYTFINCWVPNNNPLHTRIKSYKGKNVSDVFSRTVYSYFKNLVDETINTGKPQELTYYSPKFDKYYLARTTMIPRNDSFKKHITMVVQDITSIQKTRNRLEKNEANLNAIIQNTSDVFWAIDITGNMIIFNQAFDELYYNLSHLHPEIGAPLYDGFLLDETAKRWRLIHAKSLNGIDTQFSKHVHFLDGRKRFYKFHINPLKNLEGEIIGSVVTGRDIDDIYTSKKQAEKAARLKSKFVSTISHEIRTPLNAILGTCHQLELNNKQENLNEDINILHLASENLLSLINDVLDFTKLESGKSTYKPSHFNLTHLLKNISQFLRNLATNKGLEFNIDITEDLPEFITTDKTKLHQILTNLLNNAIKYTDKGMVNFRVTSNKTSKDKALIGFEIIDTGVGIPKSDLKNIFDSFTQSSTSFDLQKGGTGLGLAITKNLVNLLNGEITVKSTVGKGSIFYLELEFDIYHQKMKTTEPHYLSEDLEGINILIAEDNEINAKIITRLLGQWNASYDLACNGQIAVDYAKKTSYNLILMDIQMPKKNGFEASSEIRNLNIGNNCSTPILALTAQPDFSFDPSYQEGIFNGYILKPFHPDNLKSILLTHTKHSA